MVRTLRGFGPMTRILCVLGIGMVAGAALNGQPGAQAQDAGSAALAAQIAALTARIDALEAEKDKPQSVKAPFEVLGADGAPIFAVRAEGGGASLIVGTGNSGVVTLSTAGDELELALAKGNSIVRLTAAGDGAELNVGGASGSVLISQKGDAPSLSMRQGSDEIFKVDTSNGGPQVTVQKSGQIVRLVAIPNQTGVFADANGTHFQMGDIESIRGFVASRGDLPFAGLGSWGDDKYRVVIYNGSSSPVFEGGFERDSGKLGVFVSDQGGNRVGEISSGQGGAGELKLSKAGGKEIAKLGAPDTGDGGQLTLGGGPESLIAKATAGEATVVAKVGAKRTESGVGKKSTGFVIGQEGKPLAAMADNGDAKPFLGIYGGGSATVLKAGYEENGRLAFRIGEPNKPMAKLEQSETSAGELNLYGPNGGRSLISIGVAAGGNAGVRIYEDGGNNQAVAIAAKPGGGGALRVYQDGVAAAGVEVDEEGGAVYVAKGGKELAVMKALGKAGAIGISNGSADIVRLVDGGNGGSIVVSDSGGADVLEARADPSVGGLVCVNYKNVEKCLGRGLTGMEGFH